MYRHLMRRWWYSTILVKDCESHIFVLYGTPVFSCQGNFVLEDEDRLLDPISAVFEFDGWNSMTNCINSFIILYDK